MSNSRSNFSHENYSYESINCVTVENGCVYDVSVTDENGNAVDHELTIDDRDAQELDEFDVEATYTSVFDDSIIITTKCKYNTRSKRCFDIETVDNDEADNANSLTDEYVTVNGKEFREAQGVTFDY